MVSAAPVARATGLLLSALSTGVLFGTRTSLGPSTRRFTPATYVEVQQATIRNLRPVMGILLPGATVVNVVALALSRDERDAPPFALTLAGVASQLVVLALTAAVELPINSRVLRWSPAGPPVGWEAARDRWADVHTLRTAVSVAGLGCHVAAAVASGG